MVEASGAIEHGLASIRVQFGDQGLNVLVRVQRLLAATAAPVTVDQVAAAAGCAIADIEAQLARHPSIERDDSGRIVGFGLTLLPTPHRFTFDGTTVYGWCASDVLTFPVLLGQAGVAESTCPVTGRRIAVEVTPRAVLAVDPAGAVVSVVRPSSAVADLRAEICSLGLFLSSPEAAAPWLKEHPEGQVRPVAEDFEVHRQIFERLGWAAR